MLLPTAATSAPATTPRFQRPQNPKMEKSTSDLLHIHICVTSKISPENCAIAPRPPVLREVRFQGSQGLDTTTSDMAFRSLLRARCHCFYAPSSDQLDIQHILI